MASAQLQAYQTNSDPLDKLMSLSSDLHHLLSHGNSVYSDVASADFENYIRRKTALMQDFEKEAQNLLNYVSMGISSPKTRQLITSEVERIRQALKVNATYQLRQIKAKLANISAIDGSENLPMSDTSFERQMTCH